MTKIIDLDTRRLEKKWENCLTFALRIYEGLGTHEPLFAYTSLLPEDVQEIIARYQSFSELRERD